MKRILRKFLIYFLLLFVLVYSGYFAFVYYVPYSEGVKSGELIKITHQGILVKTWEGEISQGIAGAQTFNFSVEDKHKEVIDQLKEYQGNYVRIEYAERYRTFFWWGETIFFVTKVSREETPHFNPKE